MPDEIISSSSPLNKTASAIVTVPSASSSILEGRPLFKGLILATLIAGSLVIQGDNIQRQELQNTTKANPVIIKSQPSIPRFSSLSDLSLQEIVKPRSFAIPYGGAIIESSIPRFSSLSDLPLQEIVKLHSSAVLYGGAIIESDSPNIEALFSAMKRDGRIKPEDEQFASDIFKILKKLGIVVLVFNNVDEWGRYTGESIDPANKRLRGHARASAHNYVRIDAYGPTFSLPLLAHELVHILQPRPTEVLASIGDRDSLGEQLAVRFNSNKLTVVFEKFKTSLGINTELSKLYNDFLDSYIADETKAGADEETFTYIYQYLNGQAKYDLDLPDNPLFRSKLKWRLNLQKFLDRMDQFSPETKSILRDYYSKLGLPIPLVLGQNKKATASLSAAEENSELYVERIGTSHNFTKQQTASSTVGGYIPAIGQVINQIEQFYWSFLDLLNTTEYVIMSLIGAGFLAYTTVKILRDFVAVFKNNDLNPTIPGDKEGVSDLDDNDTTVAGAREDKTAVNSERAEIKPQAIFRIDSLFLNNFFNKLYPSVSSRITKHLDAGFNDSYYLYINGRYWVVKLSDYSSIPEGAKFCREAWIKETRISRLTKGIKGIVANDPVKFLINAGRPQLAQALDNALISGNQIVIDRIINKYFSTNGKIIFVSERFENGLPLSQWALVNKGNNIKVREKIIRSLNAVLANMHSLGIVHLDLKPQNVWVFDNNEAALFDFESAVLITNNSEEEWAFHGISPLSTPLYTHPLSHLTWNGQINKLLMNGQLRQFYYSCDLYSLEMIKLFLDSRLDLSGRDRNLVALVLGAKLYEELDLDNHPERLLDYHLFVQKAMARVEVFRNNSASSALNAESFESSSGQVAFVPLKKKIGGLDEKGKRLGGRLVSEFIGDVWITAGSFPYRVLVAGDKIYVQRYNKERTFSLAYPRLININESFAIGRKFDAGISDERLSRKHCQLMVYKEDNKYMLELIDSESSNGTIVELFYPHLKSSADEYDITRQIILGYKTLRPQDRLITTSTGTLRVVSRVENGLVMSMRTENGVTKETHERLSDVLMFIGNRMIKVIRPVSNTASSAISMKDRFIRQAIKEVYLSFVLEDAAGNKKEVIVRPYQDTDYSSIGVYDMANSDNLLAYIRDSALRNDKNGSMLLVADSGNKDNPQIEGVLHFLLEDDPEYGEHIFEDEISKENIPYPIVHLVGMAVKKENKAGVGDGLRGVGRALVAGVVKTSFESEGIKKGNGHLLVENASRLDNDDQDPANFYFALGMDNLKNNTYYFDADGGKLFLKDLEKKGGFSDLTDDFNFSLEEYQSFNGKIHPQFKKYNEIIPKDNRTGGVFVSDLPVRDRIVSEIKKAMRINGFDLNSEFSFLFARNGELNQVLGYVVENLAQHEFVDDANLVMRVYLTDEPYMGIRIEFLGSASQDFPSKFKARDWFSHLDRPWSGVSAPENERSGKTWLGVGVSRVFEHFLNVERHLELHSDRHILMGWREAGVNEGCPVGSHIIAMHFPIEVVGSSGVSSPLRKNQENLLDIIKTKISAQRLNKLNSSGVFSPAEVENLLNNLVKLRSGRDIPQSMKSRIAGFLIIADCWKQIQEFLPNEIKILIFSMVRGTDDISEVEKKYNFSNGYFWAKGSSFADHSALKIDSGVRNFIDVGCGTGTTAIALATKYPGLEVIAVDANAYNLKVLFDSISDIDLPNVKIQYGDSGKLLKTMSPGTIDRVLFKDYFHYWKQYASLRGLIRVSIPLLSENGIIVIKGATGPSDAKVISKIGTSIKIPVSAVFEKTSNGIDITTVARENKIGGSNSSNSIGSSALTGDTKGGIDFRSLPIVTQAASNLGLSTMSQELRIKLMNFNLRSELNEIERLTSAGIVPSTQRIKEYIQASFLSINSPEDTQKLLSCIADILRRQEEECCATDEGLKDILVVLEAGVIQQQQTEVVLINKT
ncbi:MAG: methyltransferase domain-containing protein [Candidatus Omnitrophica bacterium]|nr:methyltransferase domain-containing protein [Candidatus Omnitrophota bacterium]